jgi:hypothetical protein
VVEVGPTNHDFAKSEVQAGEAESREKAKLQAVSRKTTQ